MSSGCRKRAGRSARRRAPPERTRTVHSRWPTTLRVSHAPHCSPSGGCGPPRRAGITLSKWPSEPSSAPRSTGTALSDGSATTSNTRWWLSPALRRTTPAPRSPWRSSLLAPQISCCPILAFSAVGRRKASLWRPPPNACPRARSAARIGPGTVRRPRLRVARVCMRRADGVCRGVAVPRWGRRGRSMRPLVGANSQHNGRGSCSRGE